MGAYCSLLIDNEVVWEEKNAIVPGIDTLFVEADKYTREVPISKYEEYGYEGELGYRVPLKTARFRLALRGYTLNNLRREYENWPKIRQQTSEYYRPEKMSEAFYSRISFDDYMASLRSVFSLKWDFDKMSDDAKYIIDCPSYHKYAFPSEDPEYALAAVLHAVEGEYVEIDLARMVADEFWLPDEPLDSWLDGHLIIITEGKTDNEFLSRAFQLLYPDYCKTIRFFDYDYRPQAGTGHNITLLKSFAAAGIRSPIIAIFDNDTAGHEAMVLANEIKLPPNMWIGTYPDIDIARNYPTVGPTGPENLDINRRACSIELYLGMDCLVNNNKPIPIQWTGYNSKMNSYQGELLEKGIVQRSFRDKLSKCEKGRVAIDDVDFDGIHCIMKTIEDAVLNFNHKMI